MGKITARAKELREIAERTVVRTDLQADQPEKGMTWCNKAFSSIAQEYVGVDWFNNMLANDIIDDIIKASDWFECSGLMAQRLANHGYFAVATHRSIPHGHITTVYPSEACTFSGKWNKAVPMLANVGPKDKTGIITANWAFGKEPSYWAYMVGPGSQKNG